MSRSSRRAEAARKQVNSPAEDFVRTAADRVGPFAQSAADRVGPLAEAAAHAIGAAADKVSPLAHSAAGRVGPFAQGAAGRVGPLAQSAADRIAPLASQAVERATPYAQTAAGRVTPLYQTAAGYAQSAAGVVVPLAGTAKQRGSQASAEAMRRFGPAFDDARVRVTPVMVAARGRVNDNLLPRLSGALGTAAATPLVAQARQRAGAVFAGNKAELVVPEEPKRRGRWVTGLVVVGAVGAVAAVVARRFFGNQDADWQAARPSAPYVPPAAPSTPTVTDTTGASDVVVDAGDDPQVGGGADIETAGAHGATALDQPAEGGDDLSSGTDDLAPVAVEEDFAATAPAPITMLNVTDSGDIEETVVDEVVIGESGPERPAGDPVGEPAGEAVAEAPGRRWSGEGVYVGTEPPEGFAIKGNERSMKYHVPESAGYGRTIAEVWFSSEEAAKEAGFVRAQR